MPSVFTGFMQQGFTFERLGVAIYNVVPCNHTWARVVSHTMLLPRGVVRRCHEDHSVPEALFQCHLHRSVERSFRRRSSDLCGYAQRVGMLTLAAPQPRLMAVSTTS